MELFTEKLLLKDIDFSFSIKPLVKDILGDPAVPYRKEGDIPFHRRYGVQEKVVTEGLGEGQIRHWISTVTIDTYGEVMLPKGAQLKHYKKNPMVLWGHNYTQPENIMGSNLQIEATDKGLMTLTQFALGEEKAARVYRLYKSRHLRMWSVGFIPIKGAQPKKPKKDADLEKLYEWIPNPEEVQWIHQKWRLLEYSAVPVGANPDALTVAVKSIGGPDDLVVECQRFSDGLLDKLVGKTIIDLGGLSKDDPKEEERKEKEEEKAETEGAEKIEAVKKELVKQGFYEKEEDIGELERMSEHINFDDETVGVVFDGRSYLVDPDMTIKEVLEDDELGECPFCDEEGNLLSLDDFEWDSAEGVDPETFRKEYEEGEKIDDDEVTKPLPNTHSCRLVDPEKFKKGSFKSYSRTAGNGKAYRVIAGRLKGKTKMTEQSFRYAKDTWSASEAKKHCKEHKGILFEPAAGKEAENEYAAIKIEDIKEIQHKLAEMGMEIAELKEVREGRVLSGKNRQIVTDAVKAMKTAVEKLEELLEATEPKEAEEQSEIEVKEEESGAVMELTAKEEEFEDVVQKPESEEVVLTVTDKKEDMKDRLDFGKVFKKALDEKKGAVK